MSIKQGNRSPLVVTFYTLTEKDTKVVVHKDTDSNTYIFSKNRYEEERYSTLSIRYLLPSLHFKVIERTT